MEHYKAVKWTRTTRTGTTRAQHNNTEWRQTPRNNTNSILLMCSVWKYTKCCSILLRDTDLVAKRIEIHGLQSFTKCTVGLQYLQVQCWGPEVFQIVFLFLQYLHYTVHNELSREWDPSLKQEVHLCLICKMYISLKVISCNIFNNFVHGTKLHDVEFSTCGITPVLKKLQNLEHWGS